MDYRRGGVIGVDPSVRSSGMSYVDTDGVLRATLVLKCTDKKPFDHRTVADWMLEFEDAEVVIESPLRRPFEKTDPQILIRLAERAGEFYGIASTIGSHAVRYIRPTEWKGTIKKEIMHNRILSYLTDMEKALIPCRNNQYQSDCVDSVGIARWAIKQRTVIGG